ncbi:LppP/LprE family lipoprotein [Nocardia sp. NPDC058666]|uniref:LppP/LprE family lipoprotein n=1 Tax=Nocardia sp. NPDC058666 TaxID=3346587 RepID=UPI00365FE137
MKNAVRMSALIAVAVAMVTGCTDGTGSGTGTSTPRSTAASSAKPAPGTGVPAPGTEVPAATPAPQPEETTAPEIETPPATADPTVAPVPETTTSAPAPANNISGPGRCIDTGSTGVQNALASLGGGWVAGQASANEPGMCGELLWVRAIGGNSAGAPIHVLFFHDGKYLGTGTSEPYAFTTVVGSNLTSATVQYRWLAGDEPFAAPQGGPVSITYSWNGSNVVMGGSLPSEVTQPHR